MSPPLQSLFPTCAKPILVATTADVCSSQYQCFLTLGWLGQTPQRQCACCTQSCETHSFAKRWVSPKVNRSLLCPAAHLACTALTGRPCALRVGLARLLRSISTRPVADLKSVKPAPSVPTSRAVASSARLVSLATTTTTTTQRPYAQPAQLVLTLLPLVHLRGAWIAVRTIMPQPVWLDRYSVGSAARATTTTTSTAVQPRAKPATASISPASLRRSTR